MRKTLIITEVFFPEEFIINDLVAHWADEGKEMEVLTRVPSYPKGIAFEGYKNALFQKSIYAGVQIHHIPFIWGYQKSGFKKILNYLNYVFFSLLFLIRNGRKYNRIFIYQTGPITNAFSATILKWIYKWKIVIWTQDLWPETVYAYGIKENKLTRFFLNQIVRFIYNRCDEILVSCKGFIPKIESLVKDKSYHWIPNWTLVEGKSIHQLTLNGEFNFTFAGNIGKVQNLENLLIGFDQVVNEFPNVYFNIIGDGSHLESLKNLVDEKHLKNIIFHGRKPTKMMPSYFEISDVLVLSLVKAPLFEIMIPSKFQAYLHAQKPIFSVVSGELNNLVKEFQIGLTAEPSNLDSIVQGFKSFLQLSPKALKEMTLKSDELETLYFNKAVVIHSLTTQVFNG